MNGLSRRALALTCIGAFFLLQGMQALGSELSNPDWAILYEAIPRPVRAGMWTAAGLATVIWAWSRQRQWVAVVAAVIMPIERIISYLWSALQWFIPGPPGGSLWSLLTAAMWAAMVALILVIAGWVEWDRAGGAHEL